MEVFVYNKFENLPSEEWDVLLNKDDFFLSSSCLKILEAEHAEEVTPLYLIFKIKSIPIGIVYCQTFKINGSKLKEYIDNGQTNKNIFTQVRANLALKIKTEVAFLGNLFLTNDQAFKFKKGYSIHSFTQTIIEKTIEHSNAKFILIPEFYANGIEHLGINCKRIHVEPDMELKIPLSWNSFSDYLNAINSKYKKRYRKVIKNSSSLLKKELSATDLKRESQQLKLLFNNVYNKSKFNAAKFNTEVFYDLKLVKDQVSIYGYYFENKLIGFQSDISSNGVLYAHFVGLDYDYNKKFDVYNRMLYEQIEYAISNNLETIKFGRTASEFKSTIGAIPVNNYGYVYHPCKSVMIATSPLLSLIKPKEWIQRNPFK